MASGRCQQQGQAHGTGTILHKSTSLCVSPAMFTCEKKAICLLKKHPTVNFGYIPIRKLFMICYSGEGQINERIYFRNLLSFFSEISSVNRQNRLWYYRYMFFNLQSALKFKVNSAMMSTLTAHCQWEDETVRERTGHPPSYAVAKKMKLLTLHTHGCPRSSLRD